MYLSEEVVIKESSESTNMHHASGAGSVSNPDLSCDLVRRVLSLEGLHDISIVLVYFLIEFFLHAVVVLIN